MKKIKSKIYYTSVSCRRRIAVLITILVSVCSLQHLKAQNNFRSLIQNGKGMSAFITTLLPDRQVPFVPSQAKSILNLDSNTDLVLITKEPDQYGEIHYRFYQTYKSIPIENSMYIMHTKDGKLIGMGGEIILDFDSLQMRKYPGASITKENALRTALDYVHASAYAWQSGKMEDEIKEIKKDKYATYYPSPELAWYNTGAKINPHDLHLTYKVEVYATKPLSQAYYFIDVQTGKIIGQKSLLYDIDATGTASTLYSGTQTIHSDHSGSTYTLADYTKGFGIVTKYVGGSSYTSTSNDWNSSTSPAAISSGAVDAQWGMAQAYSYYKTKFNRNSIDNFGYELIGIINPSIQNNAYWNTVQMNYGIVTEKCSGTGNPVVSPDITAHELTHGLTQYTSRLNYSGESGAMNESMSDIFGKSIEFWSLPGSTNWIIGDRMNWELRDMSNPWHSVDCERDEAQPKTYGGHYWISTNCSPVDSTTDYCGVHTNSGVGNYMFYLLVTGGSGTNDNGNSYNVSGIGHDEAEAILYRSETVYLTSTSNYADWRVACVQSARDIYGSCSNEAYQTANAWYAVGVGGALLQQNASISGSLPNSDNGYATVLTLNYSGTVNPSSQQTFVTSNQVTLTAGCTVLAGANFTAYVLPCTTSISKQINNNYTGTAIATANNNAENIEVNRADKSLVKVYPNPFTNSTTLQINLEKAASVSVSVYDLTGRLVDKPVNNKLMPAGVNQLNYTNNKITANTYLFTVDIDNKRYIQKVIKM